MYRKDADRKIIRDVRERLAALRETHPWADWRLALTASVHANPTLYRHHSRPKESVEPLLREAGVDMTEREWPFQFVGNQREP